MFTTNYLSFLFFADPDTEFAKLLNNQIPVLLLGHSGS